MSIGMILHDNNDTPVAGGDLLRPGAPKEAPGTQDQLTDKGLNVTCVKRTNAKCGAAR
jgi:hypothetical protein